MYVYIHQFYIWTSFSLSYSVYTQTHTHMRICLYKCASVFPFSVHVPLPDPVLHPPSCRNAGPASSFAFGVSSRRPAPRSSELLLDERPHPQRQPLPCRGFPAESPHTHRQSPRAPASPRVPAAPSGASGTAIPSSHRDRSGSARLLSAGAELIPHRAAFSSSFPSSPSSQGIPTGSAVCPENTCSAAEIKLVVLAALIRRVLRLYLSLSLIYDLSAPVDTVFHTAYIVGLHSNIHRISQASTHKGGYLIFRSYLVMLGSI